MICRTISLHVCVAVACIALVAAGGCGSSPQQQMKDAYRNAYRENGRRLVALYTQFMSFPSKPVRGPEDFKGPTNEAEFKAFISKVPVDSLADMGITSAGSDELFKSERDGMPFRIRYGFKGGMNTVFNVLCESQGANGKVKVFKSNGTSAEMSVAEAEKCLEEP